MKTLVKRNNGFTIIELMIVVVIIGILAAIAFPSYNKYVLQSKRVEGRAALMDTAALLERYYSDRNRFAIAANTMPAEVTAQAGATSETGLYNITIDTVNTTFQSYILTATPTFTDAECTTLTLSQAGTKGFTGTGSSCW